MPWSITKSESLCSASEPWAVVKKGDGTLEGCHASRSDAQDQIAALNASEADTTKQFGRAVRVSQGLDLCLECGGLYARNGATISCRCAGRLGKALHGETGVMLALWLPEPLARAIALAPGVSGNIAWDRLHVTLAFLGRLDSIQPDVLDRLLTVVPQFAQRHTPMFATVGGYGEFPPDDQNRVTVYAPVDAPDLPTFRHDLTELLDDAGVPYDRSHGFTPHVTLGTFLNGMIPEIESLPDLPFDFTHLTLAVGEQRIEWPFMGAVDPLAVLVKHDTLPVDDTDVAGLRVLADQGDDAAAEVLLSVGLANVGKRQFSQEQRDELADEGKAMPDGSFPIVNRTDLRNAIQAFGRADNKAATKRHIIRRARALGATDMLPDDWDVSKDAGHNLQMGVTKTATIERYTFGPLYVPDFIDAHGEYSTPDDLQKAVWEYVRSGDRRIRHQHQPDVVVGEWVELAVWPQPVEVEMTVPGAATKATTVTFPADTPFMGVVWHEDFWPRVERGEIRGYSLGGKAKRLSVDVELG